MRTSSPDPRASREARFRAVYEATYDDLLRFAQRRVDRHCAEDVAAVVFLVAWRQFDDMPEQIGDARPWLFGVARAAICSITAAAKGGAMRWPSGSQARRPRTTRSHTMTSPRAVSTSPPHGQTVGG